MSALRLATPTGARLIDLGPASPAPLRGFSHRPHGIGNSFLRPLPVPSEPVRVTVCGMCGEPLRWVADRFAWVHVERGADHAPHLLDPGR